MNQMDIIIAETDDIICANITHTSNLVSKIPVAQEADIPYAEVV